MLGLRPVTCYLFDYFVLYFNFVSLTCLFNWSCLKISHIVPAMLCCFGVLFGVAVGWFPYYSQSTVACLFASVLHHLAALFCLFLSFYTSLCVIIFWYWIQLSLCVFHSFSPCIVYCCGCGAHICMYFMPCVLYCCGAHIHICTNWSVFLLIFAEFVLVSYRALYLNFTKQNSKSPLHRPLFYFFRQVKWSFLISPFLTVNPPFPRRRIEKERKEKTRNNKGNKKATTEQQLSLTVQVPGPVGSRSSYRLEGEAL